MKFGDVVQVKKAHDSRSGRPLDGCIGRIVDTPGEQGIDPLMRFVRFPAWDTPEYFMWIHTKNLALVKAKKR